MAFRTGTGYFPRPSQYYEERTVFHKDIEGGKDDVHLCSQ